MNLFIEIIVPIIPVALLLWLIFNIPTPHIDRLIDCLLGEEKETS